MVFGRYGFHLCYQIMCYAISFHLVSKLVVYSYKLLYINNTYFIYILCMFEFLDNF